MGRFEKEGAKGRRRREAKKENLLLNQTPRGRCMHSIDEGGTAVEEREDEERTKIL